MEEKHLNRVESLLEKFKTATENYDHIELDEEETKEALRVFRRAKHGRIEEKKYLEQISKPAEYKKLTAEELHSFALAKAIEIEPRFVIDESNRYHFQILSLYFSGDERAEMFGLSLSKGVMLLGPVGCGKTTMLKAFMLNSHNPLAVVSCRLIADKYAKNGSDALYFYSNLIPCYPQQNFGHTGLGVCFDDLGTESSKKNFGNEANVMHEIILNRYDKPELKGKTHFTANLSMDMVEDFYGPRVRSRLREMCNVIEFDIDMNDRRS